MCLGWDALAESFRERGTPIAIGRCSQTIRRSLTETDAFTGSPPAQPHSAPLALPSVPPNAGQ
jgi:hypothetical protein